MAEIGTTIIACIARTYELTRNGRTTRIKSTKPVSLENEAETFLKEKQEILDFFDKYEVLDMGCVPITSETESSKPILMEKATPKPEVDIPLPREDDVINYITSKESFEHNTIDLQERFLGRRLPVRENPTLYSAFDNIARKARKYIADKYNIIWDNRERKSYGSKIHVTVYKIKKLNDPVSAQGTLDPSVIQVSEPTKIYNLVSV